MEQRGTFAMVLAWLGFAGKVFMSNLSVVLSILCGIGALVASIYSVRVARARLREMTCSECRRGVSVHDCPYPPLDRPPTCPWYNKEKQ